MPGTRYEFSAELWRWVARTDEWVFVRLPDDVSADIAAVPRLRAGFGAVKVAATIGDSRWRTSIFPECTGGPYVLPVKYGRGSSGSWACRRRSERPTHDHRWL